jgi:hypothetical protein
MSVLIRWYLGFIFCYAGICSAETQVEFSKPEEAWEAFIGAIKRSDKSYFEAAMGPEDYRYFTQLKTKGGGTMLKGWTYLTTQKMQLVKETDKSVRVDIVHENTTAPIGFSLAMTDGKWRVDFNKYFSGRRTLEAEVAAMKILQHVAGKKYAGKMPPNPSAEYNFVQIPSDDEKLPAILAYPKTLPGKTFLVKKGSGAVYGKFLGAEIKAAAEKIKSYSIDETWEVVASNSE